MPAHQPWRFVPEYILFKLHLKTVKKKNPFIRLKGNHCKEQQQQKTLKNKNPLKQLTVILDQS